MYTYIRMHIYIYIYTYIYIYIYIYIYMVRMDACAGRRVGEAFLLDELGVVLTADSHISVAP